MRRSGVEKLKRLIRPGYNRDSVITCFEKRGECDKNGIPMLHEMKDVFTLDSPAATWQHDPHHAKRRLYYIDGNHRLTAVRELLKHDRMFKLVEIPRVKLVDVEKISVPSLIVVHHLVLCLGSCPRAPS